METFSALLGICARKSPVTGEYPAQRPVTPGFDDFFDLCLNKLLNKQPRGWYLRHHRAHYDVIEMSVANEIIIVFILNGSMRPAITL